MTYDTLKQLNISRGVDDTDPAFHIVYNGSSTVAADLTSDELTITIDSVDTDYDLTASAYDTMGELWDAIEAQDSGLTVIPVGAIRSDSTNATLLDATSVTLSTTGNALTILWDTSAIKARYACLGLAEDTTLPVQARTAEITAPFKRDGSDPSGQSYSAQKTAARLNSMSLTATYGSGSTVVNIYRSTKAADVLIYGPDAHSATTATDVIDHDQFGNGGLECGLGERIVVKASNSTTAPTSSTLSIHGEILG